MTDRVGPIGKAEYREVPAADQMRRTALEISRPERSASFAAECKRLGITVNADGTLTVDVAQRVKQRRAEAWARVEQEMREAGCAVGRPYSDDFIWTHAEDGSLLDAFEKRNGGT